MIMGAAVFFLHSVIRSTKETEYCEGYTVTIDGSKSNN